MASPSNERFRTTRWTLIRHASSPEDDESGPVALADFCKNYREPLLAFAKATVSNREEAEDLIQGFFEKLLERNFLAAADPSRGRLRTFLLTCLKRHITDEYRKSAAAKRGGGITQLSLEEAGSVTSDALGPEALYHRQWALVILERSVATLQEAWAAKGKAELFEALKPFLGYLPNEESDRELLAGNLGMSKGALKTLLYRLRKEYREVLLQEVGETLDSKTPDEVMEELKELLVCV